MIGRFMTFPFEALSACRAELEAEATINDGPAAFPITGWTACGRWACCRPPCHRHAGGTGLAPKPMARRGCCICCVW
ncbi:hypothetical protein RAA17_13180 [Komagataeibacter rhaeticus]|nr:hypothetical protein [Komagataeibacter rhaeticus]